MKKIFFILTLLISSVLLIPAQKKQLTIEDAVAGQWKQLYPEHIQGIKAYSENDFTYVTNYKEIHVMNKTGKDIKILTDLKELNSALKNAGHSELKYFPYWDYQWPDKEHLTFKDDGNYYVYNLQTKKIETDVILPKDASNINPCYNNNYVAYTVKNNLYFADNKSETVQITFDENEGIVNGSDYVHRQEFGINKGIFWSPEGNYIAFYRKDETMVADYPLVDISTRIATVKNTKYPMIGEKSEEVTLGIYNLKTGKTVFCDVQDFTKEHYLTSIT